MKIIGNLGQEFGQYVIELTAELMGAGDPKSLSEMERQIRQMLLKLGQFLLGAWLRMLVEPYPVEKVSCSCGGEAEYQFNRSGTLLTLVGQIEYKRPYYLCGSCQKGLYPLDRKLGLRPGQISAELESLSGMTGAQLSFGQGSQLFEALTLISLSNHSLAKATQAIGSEVQAQEKEWVAQSQDEGWLQRQDRLADRPKRLYGSLDAAKVHIRGEEEDPWRDLKVGAWFTTTAKPPQQPDEDWKIEADEISYYCDVLEAKEFGHLLWATGCQRHAQGAEELIFLGDGAEWIWNLVQEHYPEAIQIVDWFHATEYIAPVANAAFTDKDNRQSWSEQVRTDLWEGKLDEVITAFERLTEHQRAGEAATKAVTYFSNNQHRMDYPTYRAQGYQIGSGTIESGCKQIVSQRLKIAGAIWDLDNAIKTAKARAALLSGQWDTITSRREYLALPLAA
ncbi:MAG: ISKra4 family transposase [Anaerolineae bacterium]|nr:ISKra4 family transposase [Anaerolineae bacterium]